MSDFITYTAEDYLSLYQTEYQEETGEAMLIGSREHAEAVVHSYVLNVATNAINYCVQQNQLMYASGTTLDAIADTWDVERPSGNRATTTVTLKNVSSGEIQYYRGTLVVEDANGNKFENVLAGSLAAVEGSTYAVVFRSQTAGSAYNNISAFTKIYANGTLTNLITIMSSTVSSGGTDGFTDDSDGDDDFRDYIREQRRGRAIGGTAWSYEARAKAADERVSDAYCLRETDLTAGLGGAIYSRGNINIYLIDVDGLSSTQKTEIIANVKSACTDDDFKPIGDNVNVYNALSANYTFPSISVKYPLKFQAVAYTHFVKIFNEYKAYLLAGFNRPFSTSEFAKRVCTADSDGVYALECESDALRVDAGPGAVITLTYTAPTITYIRTAE